MAQVFFPTKGKQVGFVSVARNRRQFKEGRTIVRITGDPVLVQALREIGIEATKEKKVYDMVMAIRDAVAGEVLVEVYEITD